MAGRLDALIMACGTKTDLARMGFDKLLRNVFLSVLLIESVACGPLVKILNGTLEGYSLTDPAQDVFLGIPYAQAPVGDLRFRAPQSLNETWEGTKTVVAYSPVVSLRLYS